MRQRRQSAPSPIDDDPERGAAMLRFSSLHKISQAALAFMSFYMTLFWEKITCKNKIEKASNEEGFTLVESLIAGTLSLCIVIPAYAMLNSAYRTAALINSRFQRDAEARQILTLLGEGTASFGTLKNARGFTMVEGIRSRQSLPPTTLLTSWNLNNNGQFVMSDTAAGGILSALETPPSIAGDAISPITVTCTGNALPLPGCTAGAKLTVKGWMGADPVLTQAGSTVVAVDITVSDPFQAARPGQTAAGVTDTYRTLFNLNVEANP